MRARKDRRRVLPHAPCAGVQESWCTSTGTDAAVSQVVCTATGEQRSCNLHRGASPVTAADAEVGRPDQQLFSGLQLTGFYETRIDVEDPRRIASGDFDGDGFLDLAATDDFALGVAYIRGGPIGLERARDIAADAGSGALSS